MSERARAGRTRLASRFLLYYALTFLFLIGVTGVFIERSTRSALIDETARDLEVVAQLGVSWLPANPEAYSVWADTVFEGSGYRTTLIDHSGLVLADSHSDPEVMENHADRPEVVTAMTGEVGVATRTSASTGSEQLYVALPPVDGSIVRTSVALRTIAAELDAVRRSIIVISVITGMIGIGIVAYLGRRMARPITELTDQSLAVANGDLDIAPRRSTVQELDQLGFAINTMANELGNRVVEAERANEYLETVLGALSQGTVLIGADGQVAYSNPAATELLGPVGSDLASLSPFQCQTLIREARDTGETVERIVEHGRPPRHLRAVATPFADDDRTLLVIIDVTAQERADAVRRDFVANASHELKTPITTIIASSDALRIAVERGDESALAFASQVQASALQLGGLVSDLLDLSRLERETPELSPVRLDLVVSDEVERIRADADEKGIDLSLETSAVVVLASHRDVAIAVRNLLDNAIRYTTSGGAVSVRVDIEGDEAVLSVTDTGEGIPSRDLERVFERFYRVDSGRARATGGTGLGLSIVKHVMDTHHGTVEVESELGSGSTFTLRFPLLAEGSVSVTN